MVLCCDPLAIALTAAASARRSITVLSRVWSAVLSIAAVMTLIEVTAAKGQLRTHAPHK
jgi:hypothetical protein